MIFKKEYLQILNKFLDSSKMPELMPESEVIPCTNSCFLNFSYLC